MGFTFYGTEINSLLVYVVYDWFNMNLYWLIIRESNFQRHDDLWIFSIMLNILTVICNLDLLIFKMKVQNMSI